MSKNISLRVFGGFAFGLGLMHSANAYAQCAGCDADFNRADRAAVAANRADAKANKAESGSPAADKAGGMIKSTRDKIIKNHQRALDASKN